MTDMGRCQRSTGDENSLPGDSKLWNTAQRNHVGQGSGQNSKPRRLSHHDYTVGWICALPIELAAATAMLDVIHESLTIDPSDSNTYTLGYMGNHNVVIACLPIGGYGTNNAATVASNMGRSFRSIRTRLMAGVGGGVPGRIDVRLGDVVVSKEVVQYDYGKTIQEGRFQRTGTLNKPPQALLTAVAKLEAAYASKRSEVPAMLSDMLARSPTMTKYTHAGSSYDRLFDANYDHERSMDNCEHCDVSRLVLRVARSSTDPIIHYGIIASGNKVMKHGMTRDRLAKELDVLCFEMEAAGLMDSFPCLVIRGICDYSDSHKNKQWQEYAAATAAAYAKELLSILSHGRAKTETMSQIERDQKVADRRKQLLGSLKFEGFDSRRLNVQARYAETCQWLLEHPVYVKWLDPTKAVKNHGFLWIKGKPGAGKSTIMNFAYEKATEDKTSTVISFFFNARGGSLERSTTGMYRSLLFQLLKAMPKLLSVLDKPKNEDEVDALHTISKGGANAQWDVGVLQNLLGSAISRLEQQHVMIFIDALDECNVGEVEEIVELFESLGDSAFSKRIRLNICFSSRHYPHIEIKYGQELVLDYEEGHKTDIATYIHSKLKVGKGKAADGTKDRILLKAHGVFIWVVLVVCLLNKECRGGRMFAVRNRLDTIPEKLGDLFKEILLRDEDNLQDLRLCIQWVLFAHRPLRLEEYYFALAFELSPDCSCEWDTDEVTMDDMEKFVTSSSKGLAETTASKTVQFIHESVREFLFKDGLRELWPDLTADFRSFSHSQLRQRCYSYILKLDVPDLIPQEDSLGSSFSDERDNFQQSLSKRLPLLKYATQNVLYHADSATHHFPQDNFLEQFDLKAWIRLDNVFKHQNVPRNSPNATLLYVLAENGLPNLVKIALHFDGRCNIQGESYKYPLFAAIANGHQDAIRALTQQDKHLVQGKDVAAELKYGNNRGFLSGQTPLHWAMCHNYPSLARLLIMSKEFDLNLCDYHDGVPLLWAAKMGHHSIVELLLATEGVDVNWKDRNGRSPLSCAIASGNESIVKLLLSADRIDVKLQNNWGETPMLWAAMEQKEAMVLLLYAAGADVVTRDWYGRTPLSWAAATGHEAITRLLLSAEGVNVNSRDGQGRTPLFWAAVKGHQAIAKLLLNEGADIELEDAEGQTPMSWALAHDVAMSLVLQRL